jgi:hypothetical protein
MSTSVSEKLSDPKSSTGQLLVHVPAVFCPVVIKIPDEGAVPPHPPGGVPQRPCLVPLVAKTQIKPKEF